MRVTRRREPGYLIALGFLCLSTAITGWAAWRAATLEPTTLTIPGRTLTAFHAPTVRSGTPAATIRTAIATNPFRPERSPAPIAFHLPGQAQDEPVATPRLALVLVGTALLPNGGSFAMCRLGSEPFRVIRIGERVGPYTLRTVEQGRARFQTSEGAMLEIEVPKAGT